MIDVFVLLILREGVQGRASLASDCSLAGNGEDYLLVQWNHTPPLDSIIVFTSEPPPAAGSQGPLLPFAW